jgi:hypothetical protein
MAQERPNRILEWYLLAKEHLPELRRGFAEWLSLVREEPRLLWETTAFRYGVYGVSALIAIWMVTAFVGFLQPPNTRARREATTANYYVICTNPSCGERFMVNREFGFRDFPVECPKCRKETGMAGRKCNSKACGGVWVVPVEEGDGSKCPRCGTAFATP